MLIFDEILSKGFDPRNFINGYAAHLRDLMVCKDPETVKLMEVGAGIREKYLAQSSQVSLHFLYSGLEICNQADIQFRASRNQRLTIELALVKLANLTEVSKKKIVAELSPEKPSGSKAQEESELKETVQKSESATSVPSTSETTDTSSQASNDNGASRIVRSSGISIRDSLKGPSVPVEHDTEPVLASEEPAKITEPADGDSKEADPDAVLRAWNDYALSIEKSKPRIYSTLTSNRPVVRGDGAIQLLLNSESQRDNFNAKIKSELVGFIRSKTGFSSVEIITEVAESVENEKKLYTEQDKLDFLIKKNPELGTLKSRFNLDFDD
jgi:DNA polymerase-3 subunit gamma/tau